MPFESLSSPVADHADQTTIDAIAREIADKQSGDARSELERYANEYEEDARRQISGMEVPENIEGIADDAAREQAISTWKEDLLEQMKNDPASVLGFVTAKLEELDEQEHQGVKEFADAIEKGTRVEQLYAEIAAGKKRLEYLEKGGVGDHEGLGKHVAALEKELKDLEG